jgi:hypothetical protein
VDRKLGHVGPAIIRKTLKASNGIELRNNFKVLECSDCNTAKAKRNKISKGNAYNHETLDVVEIDVQGPFPVVANDGTTSNVKMIDSNSVSSISPLSPMERLPPFWTLSSNTKPELKSKLEWKSKEFERIAGKNLWENF